ncbi:MAG: DUF7681 family protein [Candidatus Pacearchaeota archaeon]
MNEQLERALTYFPANDDTKDRYHVIRQKIKEVAYLLDELCPNSREKSLALTNLEQASMWANASIARTPVEQLPPRKGAVVADMEEPKEPTGDGMPEGKIE